MYVNLEVKMLKKKIKSGRFTPDECKAFCIRFCKRFEYLFAENDDEAAN